MVSSIYFYNKPTFTKEEINNICYIPSKEFANTKLNLSEFISLCKSVKEGDVQILEEDLYEIARKSGYINASTSWEDFKKRYKIEAQERQNANAVLPKKTNGNPFAQGKNNDNSGNNAE